jgi:hypothetical protein
MIAESATNAAMACSGVVTNSYGTGPAGRAGCAAGLVHEAIVVHADALPYYAFWQRQLVSWVQPDHRICATCC